MNTEKIINIIAVISLGIEHCMCHFLALGYIPIC